MSKSETAEHGGGPKYTWSEWSAKQKRGDNAFLWSADLDGVRLSMRAWNVLLNAGTVSADAIRTIGKRHFLVQPNCGAGAIREIERAIGGWESGGGCRLDAEVVKARVAVTVAGSGRSISLSPRDAVNLARQLLEHVDTAIAQEAGND